MLSSLLNASPVAPRVTPRPSASPKKQSSNVGKAETPIEVDDDDEVVIEVRQSNFSSPHYELGNPVHILFLLYLEHTTLIVRHHAAGLGVIDN